MDFDEIVLSKLKKHDRKEKTLIRPVLNYKKDELFFLKSSDRHNYVLNRINFMKPDFIDLLEVNDFLAPTTQSFSSFFTIGMVFSFEERPSADSIFLVSDFNDVVVKLNLTGLKEYSLFPGQVVAAKGKNYNGNELFVEELFTMPIIETNDFYTYNCGDGKNDGDHGLAELRPLESLKNMENVGNLSKEFKESKSGFLSVEENSGTLKKVSIGNTSHLIKITAISGPLGIDNYSILDKIQEIQSDVLILTGPFVRKEDCTSSTPLSILSQIKEKLEKWIRKSMYRKVILVGSTDDHFSFGIYPQFPIPISGNDIYCFSNPTMFYINDILFGISTEDILFDLFAKELYTNPNERIARISKNFIFQKSFLPVLPPSSTVKYNEILNIKVVPNVFILISKVKPFYKKIGPCVVANLGVSKAHEERFKYEIVINRYEMETNLVKIE